MHPDRHQLTRIVFGGLDHIDEWRLGSPLLAAHKRYPRKFVADVLDDFGMVFIDVVLEHSTGRLVCHEVNGPNGVGSDALTGESSLRADNEARQAARRAAEMGIASGTRMKDGLVTIHAHQHWKAFRTGCEFYPRVADFADCLGRHLPEAEISLRGAMESLGHERVSVVAGDVPSIAKKLAVNARHRRLEYEGRPVVFVGNPNVLPELVRIGKLSGGPRMSELVDLRVFHAWRLLRAIHDKALQQKLLEGTGIDPLHCFEAYQLDEAIARTRESLERGPMVLKPNGTSGGTGVHVVVPHMTDDDIQGRLQAVIADCVAKYGPNTESTVLPWRGFEFVRSTGYPLVGGMHLWDLRIAVLFEPGEAQVFPVSMRVTPKPFDPQTFHLDRDQWVSNVSGRTGSLLLSGMDDAALASVGWIGDKLEQCFEAAVNWTAKAWDASVRDGGCGGFVHEDYCEREDQHFYPRRSAAA
jgi:hypothetical protein